MANAKAKGVRIVHVIAGKNDRLERSRAVNLACLAGKIRPRVDAIKEMRPALSAKRLQNPA